MAPSLKNIFPLTTKERPLYNNYPGVQRSNNGRQAYLTNTREKIALFEFYKSRPELNAPVSIRVNDTIKKVDFYDTNGLPLGRNKEIAAKKFWSENFMIERLKSIWFDTIVTGDGYGWDGGLTDQQIKQTIQQLSNNIQIKEDIVQKAIDEDIKTIRRFDHIPSTTVTIDADEVSVYGYTQRVGGREVQFGTKEVLHFKFQSIDGRVEGYTPISSLKRELILIYFIKENMLSHLRNGGIPRKLYKLKDENANSPNFLKLQEILASFEFVENSNGSLLLTGDIDVQDLQDKLRDMEYVDLARYIMSNIAYALSIPQGRLPYNLDQNSGGDSGGLAEAGYWSMIESDQQYIEQIFNTQLGKKLGFTIKFSKPYKIDDVRETQVMTMKADAIQKIQTILRERKLKISTKKIEKLMGLSDGDIEELTPEEQMTMPEKTGLMNQNLLNNNQVLMSQDQQAKADKKRTERANNAKGATYDGT
jgi:hypothetical protein